MADDLNLEGIDTSVLFTPEPQKPLSLDLSGIDTSILLSPASKTSRTKSSTPSPSSAYSFQPEGSDFSLDKISSIQDFYQSTFNKTLPLANQGQSFIHNKWRLDHRNAFDININPNSVEGQKLMEYLRSSNIPFLAFTHAIPGVATGSHIHVGKPSKKTGETFQVGTTLTKNENLPNLDLSGIDTSILTKAVSTPELDLSNIDTTSLDSAIAGIEPSPVDPKDVAFKATQVQFNPIAKAAYGFTAANRPQLIAKNPDEMADPIIISKQSIKKPSLNDATDIWLNQWNPEYKKINDRFRAESGGINIADLGNPGNIIADIEAGGRAGKNVWKIQARPTRESVALFEAVKEAYANGQKGVPAYLATGKLAQQQRQETQWNYTQQQTKIENYAIDHPYITAIKSAIEGSGEGNIRLLNNLDYLGKALYTGSVYGYSSQQYIDLINKEKQDAYAMQQGEIGVSRPEGFVPKVVAGVGRAGLDLPKYILAGQAGLGSLTTLAYLENLHRGNREAALAALPMAVMEGGFHGFNEFLNSGTTKSINVLETDSDGNLKFDEAGDPIPIQKTYIENPGAGNIAPFTKISNKDLSLFQDSIVPKEPISIQQLSPLGRQLLLRGTNALLFGGTALITDPNSRNIQDLATHVVIGFGMPVGKSPKTPIFNELVTPEILKIQLQLDQSRVTVPLTPTTSYGESGLRQVGDTYLPSYESPTNKYLETTTPIEPNLEKGFKAQATGQTIQLPLDTAALNLIDLERAIENGSWRTKGDNLATGLSKQKAITDAIDILQKQIPSEVLDYFRKNEDVIRAALKSNYGLNQTKTEFLERNKQSLSPDDIKVAPDKVPEINPNATTPEETFKAAGINNTDTSQTGAKDVLNTFFNAVNKKPNSGERGSFSNKSLKEGEGIVQATKEEFDKIWNKTKDGLSYLNAFFIEDLYHRGIQPTIDLVSNRLNATLGDAAKLLDDGQRKEIFAAGKAYFDSNQADPFFSRMKQDAAEKLPNKMTAEQALNVLKGHKNEFEWTVGLETFLNDKKVEKFSKQELIDIINKGQVRVEASVAEEENRNRIEEINFEAARLRKEQYNLRTYENREGFVGDEHYIDPNSSEEINEIENQVIELKKESDRLASTSLPKYSLKAYTGEKLELPGAENSKEVKLISVVQNEQQWFRVPDLDRKDGLANEYAWENKSTKEIRYEHTEEKFLRPYIEIANKYQAPHWDEPNVVAHYRSNDRTTTDGIKVYHSEEFQSDWNHDIREKGLKVELSAKEKLEYNQLGKKVRRARTTTLEEEIAYGKLITKLQTRKTGVEPNPFMVHAWKELVFKRFLRNAVVAKDENGNYKYDGITWTTARQQRERYGKILGGKEFKWRKNFDGTYSFDLGTTENYLDTSRGWRTNWQSPHELTFISLERFAELITKEAAQEVRDQEAAINSKNKIADEKQIAYIKAGNHLNTDISSRDLVKGQFSLKEAVELRSGLGTYVDYDVAFVNMAKKIGKRFGASYSEKEIRTVEDGTDAAISGKMVMDALGVPRKKQSSYWRDLPEDEREELIQQYRDESPAKIEKIHFLEITPSMRQSLEKEGFPLYGTGGSETLKNPEIGIRNKITTQQGFDQHRANLVDLILKGGDTNPEGTNAFNSGLSPDALLDFLKLTKSDVTDFLDFSGQLISQFGETIKPFLQDLWIQVKGFSSNLGEKFDLPLDNIKEKFTLGSKELKDSIAYKIRQFHQNETGRLFLTKKEPEIEELQKSRKRIPYYEWYSLWRGVGIAQLNTQAGEVYDIMRGGQRVVNSFESSNLDDLQNANKIAQVTNNKNVAETIFIGNESFKRFTIAELRAGDTATNRPALSDEEVKAYNYIRSAQDRTLELRKQHILYGLKERATDLNTKLQNATQGTPEYDRIAEQLLNINGRMTEVTHHYESLKASGYISTQRSGSIAVEGEDPNFPVGDIKRRLYSQFDTDAETNNWIAEQKANLGAINIKAYDMKKPTDLEAVTANLTPGQFEELIDSAGLNSKDPVVEQLREQVYSKFSSMGYNLKRDFIRGYDRDWKFVIDSVARQTETYGRSFYARVAGNEAVKHLEATGLRDSDYSLYQTMQKYIDDEITSGGGKAAQVFGGVRKGVYLFQLGYDINQLYLNALAQPVTQTYSYFSRVRNPSDTSKGLSGLEPEKYFKNGWSLAGRLGKEKLQQRIDPSHIDSNIPQEFRDIYSRLIKEHVVSAEFNRSLLKLESEKTISNKLTPKNKLQRVWDINEHWAGTFMRAGEKTTRTHVAAEAYLVGKEKFNLSGEDLTNFIVRSIDATQSNPTKAEAPLIVRQPFGNKGLGEGTKLLYQFNAFNHMWIENLALNVKADLENTFDAIEQKANASEKVKALGKDIIINRGASTIRHLYPLVLMGGVRNLPLAGFSGLLYTLLTGDDVKKRFDKIFGKDTLIEQLAMYGFSTSENLGGRLTPSIPFVDNLRLGNSVKSTLSETLAVTNVPAVATAAQIGRGLADLMDKKQRLRGLGEVLPFKPMRNLAIAERYREQGVRSRANKTLVPKSKVTDINLFNQVIGIAPTKLEENYDKQRSKKIIKLHKKIPLIRKIKI